MNLTWNDISWHKEGDPGHDNKEARRKVVRDDVVGHVTGQRHLETSQTVNRKYLIDTL